MGQVWRAFVNANRVAAREMWTGETIHQVWRAGTVEQRALMVASLLLYTVGIFAMVMFIVAFAQ